jgi:hypothetical protein
MNDAGSVKPGENGEVQKIKKRKMIKSKVQRTSDIAQLMYDVKICADNSQRIAEFTKQFKI